MASASSASSTSCRACGCCPRLLPAAVYRPIGNNLSLHTPTPRGVCSAMATNGAICIEACLLVRAARIESVINRALPRRPSHD